MPIHKIRKSAKATTETLPDIGGNPIVYAGATEYRYEVTERGGEVSVSAGSEGTYGIVESMVCEALPQYKLDGAVVWETTTSYLNTVSS